MRAAARTCRGRARPAGSSWRAVLATAQVVLVHPGLWWEAVRQLRRLVPSRWWRHPPFLPVPDRAWLGFRMLTQYGDPRAVPAPDDVVDFLRWCRTQG